MTPDLAGRRLDQILAAVSGQSRRASRALLAHGAVWLNARPVRVASRLLSIGDVLDLVAQDGACAAPAPEPPPFAILHEDGWLVAIDKPSGVASQPPRQRRAGELTAQERLALQLAARDGQRREVLLFHRLDRVTSGVLAFARHHEAARALAGIWARGEVDKRYLAVVCGDPGEKPLALGGAIAADPLVPGRFRVAARGRAARSEVRRLAVAGALALVEVRPMTGRTHQVRAHLAGAGFPVAGDRLYGGGASAPRPFLHAWRLRLPHPHDRSPLRLEAPLPTDMRAFLAERHLTADIDG